MPQPTYVEEGVVHYCVTNMPGAVARTSAVALNNATLPFVAGDRRPRLAAGAVATIRICATGSTCAAGGLPTPAVARDLGLPLTPPERALAE